MSEPRTIIIDFESYYDQKYTLRDLSVAEYIHDPRFKIFGMSVDLDGGQDWIKAKDIPLWLRDVTEDILVHHNAFFDFSVLRWHYKFNPAYVIDTLGLANHVLGSAREMGGGGKNDLRSLAVRLGLEPKGRLDFMKGVRDPDVAQMAALAAYAMQDAKLGREVLDILLPQVSNPEFELWLLDHSLRIFTDKTLAIDYAKLQTTKTMIEKKRAEIFAASGVALDVLNSNKKFAEELTRRMKAAKIKVPMKKAKPRKKDGSTPMIPALAKQDPAFMRLTDSPALPVASLVKARLAERSAVTVAARLATMEKYHKLGIGIPVHLVYYGAHTGRFAGGGGFNFQNLTSPARAVDPFEREVAALVRECIIAGPGEVFVPVDAAQIEARVLAWLAGEQSILDAFATGADLYSQFISEVIGENIYKPTGTEPKEVQAYLKLMRQAGKEGILGLGYSMGVDKFRERLRKEKSLVPMLEEGGKLGPAVCQNIVDTYRSKYSKIVEFWEKLNNAFLAAVGGATRRVGKIVVKHGGNRTVKIILPSGRALFYRELRREEELTPNGHKRKVWKHGAGQRIYGGLLAENVTQAIARDILAESIHDSEVAGYPVVLHVHDEVVPRVPEVQGPAALSFLIDSLSTPPSWGEGLVLGAEGHIAKTLSK
jgi:DNA polymerase